MRKFVLSTGVFTLFLALGVLAAPRFSGAQPPPMCPETDCDGPRACEHLEGAFCVLSSGGGCSTHACE